MTDISVLSLISDSLFCLSCIPVILSVVFVPCPGCLVCPDDHDKYDCHDDDDHVDHDVYGNHDDRLIHGDFGDYDQHGEPNDHGHDNHDDHLDHLYHLDHDDHLEEDGHPDHDELMTIKFVRKLEVVHKKLGGYLTRCAFPRRSLKLIIISHSLSDTQSLSQSVSYLCRYKAARAAKEQQQGQPVARSTRAN